MTLTAEEFQGKLGGEIRRLRIEQGKSQDELGTAVGIHRNTLSRYENGTDIPVMLFVRLCVALGTHGKDVLERVLPDAGKRIREANGVLGQKRGRTEKERAL
jgi:transcriptional regulator with XRE-family HTH domain